MDIIYMIILFFIYSFLGYLIEIGFVSIVEKKLIFSRGYLIGPYIPIFGVGSLIVISFLYKYQNDIFALFVTSMVLCCALEYFTSLLLEKIYGLRWWDYKDRKFNLNGRICLETGIMFGLGGIFIIKLFNPILMGFIEWIPNVVNIIIAIIILVVMIIDFIISTIAIVKLKIDTTKYAKLDATSIVKSEVKKSLSRYRFFHRRVLKAFPNMSKNKNIKNIIEIINRKKKGS